MHVACSIEQVPPANGINPSLVHDLLEIWCQKGLRWVQSQPASTPSIWEQVRTELSDHLCTLWVTCLLQGATRKEGFNVRCDHITMTQTDIGNGRLNCEVGVAPAEPGEFVVFRIRFQLRASQLTALSTGNV